MKKLLPTLIIAFACCLCQSAKAQLQRFYYYPKNNVYYNVSTREYIYNHDGGWTPVSDLPEDLSVAGTPRIVMYSMKPDVWQMNEEHLEQYKNYGGGRSRVGRLFSFRKEEAVTEVAKKK